MGEYYLLALKRLAMVVKTSSMVIPIAPLVSEAWKNAPTPCACLHMLCRQASDKHMLEQSGNLGSYIYLTGSEGTGISIHH